MDSFKTVLEAVCEACGVREVDVMSKSRRRALVDARHITMYFLREKMHKRLIDIAAYFKKSHCLVFHANKNVTSLLTSDTDFRKKYLKCLNSLDFGTIIYEHTPQY